MPVSKAVYQLKVTLDGFTPPIWRRVLVPDSVSLYQLHIILQIVMGWTDSHLHQFVLREQYYGDPEDDEFDTRNVHDENDYKLNQLSLHEKNKFSYEYDFGDSWEHTIRVEKILPGEKRKYYPLCVDGKGACPPEDVGGLTGYAYFLEAIANPKHEEHHQYMEWIGGHFDPQHFDLEKVNEQLRNFKRGVVVDAEMYSDPQAAAQAAEKTLVWAQGLGQEQIDQFDQLPMRRDMLAFLNYLLENRTVGTQSTGNLPLKAVRAICERLVHPPELDTVLGEHIYKLRSEMEVWPLYLIHILAQTGGLLAIGPARAWRVISTGQKYLQLPASIQVITLLSTWWHRVDWRIAYPFEGFSRGIPIGFELDTLACLLELPLEEPGSFDIFADRVIAKSGLVWPIEDQERARDILHRAIERMVIEQLTDFGVLECEYAVKYVGKFDYRELESIRLTRIGKGMLEIL